jgi:hypothetical protein
MDAAASETTRGWLLPEDSRPPTIAELEQRIEVAVATARASEAAVMTVGAAALDAAEQARRAAELAERASLAAVEARVVEPAPEAAAQPGSEPAPASPRSGESDLDEFSARADRLVARLRQLQRVPLVEPERAASDAAAH